MKDEVLKKVEDPSKEEKSQQELEKRIFHLKTLYDLIQEIGYLRGTHEITRKPVVDDDRKLWSLLWIYFPFRYDPRQNGYVYSERFAQGICRYFFRDDRIR